LKSNRDFYAYLDEMNIITIILPYNYHEGNSSTFSLQDNHHKSPLQLLDRILLKDAVKYSCRTNTESIIGKQFWVIDEHNGKTDLQIGAVIRTEAFDQAFYYNGILGAAYNKTETIFRLWAPTATKVQLKLIEVEKEKTEIYQMERKKQGVWQFTVHKDVEKFHYSFLVCVNLEWKEAVDPYAVSVSINGNYGIIVDMNKTKMNKPPLPPFDHPTDAIIYETHIRDFTIHRNSGITRKGTYLGAGELNTVGIDGTLTGLSYVKEFGITHIEFLPVHDFYGINEENPHQNYNWGYNPLYFNAPEGSYSSNPTEPYTRINELKAMIHSFHSEGLRVIIDVVYNHVYIREQSSFEKIVPGYFFRFNEYGIPSNGTGVGNDFASERLMARKFILDSVDFWLREYEIDGFRFDLMGILDTQTMNDVRKKVDSIDSTVLIIGEGWDLNTPLPIGNKANIHNQKSLPRISQFNDWFRDTVKGSTFNLYDRGYALGNEYYFEVAKQVLAGSIGIDMKENGIFCSPIQSVNYVESHDNHTLWDKISVFTPIITSEIMQRYHRLATTIVLLAQGIPFLHSGQEFFRTKKGIGNSYSSPDEINQLDWDRKNQFSANVEYIKGMITIRKAHRAFRFHLRAQIVKHMKFLPLKKPIIGYVLYDVGEYGSWKHIAVFLNPTENHQAVMLPKGDWHIIADNQFAGIDAKGNCENSMVLKPISSYVLVR